MLQALGFADATLEAVNVSGILVTGDGRYLMQLRDDFDHILFPDHWGLFGGGAEPGETLPEAFRREIEEELSITPAEFTRFTDIVYRAPGDPTRIRRKVFFVVPITQSDLRAMKQQEGADMRLFGLIDLLQQPKVIPSDIYGLMSHHRKLLRPG